MIADFPMTLTELKKLQLWFNEAKVQSMVLPKSKSSNLSKQEVIMNLISQSVIMCLL